MNITKGIYEHFKGKEYKVFDICTDKNNKSYVLYTPLYKDSGIWIRPYDMFFEDIEKNGILYKRFSLKEKCFETIDLQSFQVTHSETEEKHMVTKIDGKFILNL